jgi:hypothetical protein
MFKVIMRDPKRTTVYLDWKILCIFLIFDVDFSDNKTASLSSIICYSVQILLVSDIFYI